ncbi:MAG: beta-ketoacyl-ACP synthase II [Bacteriovoracaceae bacterium]|jgi:3-oxoacyl-[acyl-carrier-protein] synthase II|nr:beta-ketoacyl-ACP synthase II [Bacteriovoracaceae bacterium]
MKLNRVAITGLGIVCANGNNLEDTWKSIVKGEPGISKIENTPVADLAVQIAGEVKNFTLSPEILREREQPRYDKFIHYALSAGHEAFANSGLLTESPYLQEKMGSILGVGMGGFPGILSTYDTYLEKGPRRVSPFFIPAVIPNMASGLLTIQLGLKGLNYTISSACASATHALTAASYEIMFGRQDVMISGGAESTIVNCPMQGFISMKALSKRNDEPEKASRPFDTARDGFVMGEGAGCLVLENYDKAVARGARIYGEVVGHGATSDAHHITAPHPEGDGAYRCMEMAIQSAGIDPSLIGYVNAHGTSTPLGDIGETKAIRKTFGSHAENLLVSSTKSMTGHLLGAAGGIESVFCAMALHTGDIPPTINLENQDPECDLNYVPNNPVKKEVEYSLSNSFGFGGTNSSVLFKRATT